MRCSSHVVKGLVALALLVAAGGGFARPAKASGGDIPAISQYVESLPAASGGGSPPSGGGTGGTGHAGPVTRIVSAPVAKAVTRSGGGDRAALLKLAATAPPPSAAGETSSRLVAPARRGALSGLTVGGDLTPLVVLAIAIACSALLAGLLAMLMRGGTPRQLLRSDT